MRDTRKVGEKKRENDKRLDTERVRERTRDRGIGQETVTKVSIKEAERIYDINVGGDIGFYVPETNIISLRNCC